MELSCPWCPSLLPLPSESWSTLLLLSAALSFSPFDAVVMLLSYAETMFSLSWNYFGMRYVWLCRQYWLCHVAPVYYRLSLLMDTYSAAKTLLLLRLLINAITLYCLGRARNDLNLDSGVRKDSRSPSSWQRSLTSWLPYEYSSCADFEHRNPSTQQKVPSTTWQPKQIRFLLIQITQYQQWSNPCMKVCTSLPIYFTVVVLQ